MEYQSNDESPASIFMLFFIQFIMILLLILSIIYNVIELKIFTLIILIIGAGTYLWSQVSLYKIKCIINFDKKKLFPGEQLKIEIQITNSKPIPILFKIKLFIPETFADTKEGQWINEKTLLPWYHHSLFSRNYFPKKRGVYNIGSPLIRGGDIFGFHFKNIMLNDKSEIVVYPRIVDIQTIKFSRREFYGIPESWSPIKDPIYIFGTHDYQQKRPARDIHWKASARLNRLQEKIYEPTEQSKLLILLDVEQLDSENKMEIFERLLEIIASMALQIDSINIPLGLITNGHILGNKSKIIPISRSSMQISLILETLARVNTKKDNSLLNILSNGYKIPWGTDILYFGYNHGKQTISIKSFMNNKNLPVQFILAKKTINIYHHTKHTILEHII